MSGMSYKDDQALQKQKFLPSFELYCPSRTVLCHHEQIIFDFEAAELFVDRAASRDQFPDSLIPLGIIAPSLFAHFLSSSLTAQPSPLP
jgi:hypothetical protein